MALLLQGMPYALVILAQVVCKVGGNGSRSEKRLVLGSELHEIKADLESVARSLRSSVTPSGRIWLKCGTLGSKE